MDFFSYVKILFNKLKIITFTFFKPRNFSSRVLYPIVKNTNIKTFLFTYFYNMIELLIIVYF